MSKRLGVLTGLLLAATLLYASSTPISGTENHMYVAQVNGGTNITVEAAMFQPDRSDVQPESELCNALSEGAIYMNTTSHTLRFCNASVWGDIGSFGASSGTLNTVPKFTPNGTTLGNSSITDDGTVVTINGATEVYGASDGTASFLNVTGTLPTVPTADSWGVRNVISSAGSESFEQIGTLSWLGSGYTGSKAAVGLYGLNNAASTDATGWTGGRMGNIAVLGEAYVASVGASVGGRFDSRNSTGPAIGSIHYAQTSAGGKAVGLVARAFISGGGGARTGAYIGFGALEATIPEAGLVVDNSGQALPIALFLDNGSALPTTGATATWAILDGAIPQYGLGVLTSATMAASTQAYQTQSTSSYTWTNAQVVALGASFTGNITVATLPAKTQVLDAAIVITGQASGVTTLTVSCGDANGGTPFIDYILPSDAKAAVNTFYGDAVGERGASLDVEHYYLPSYTATKLVTCHFISTVQNLDQTTGSTGRVILTTRLLP
jgi:hypothetical protein